MQNEISIIKVEKLEKQHRRAAKFVSIMKKANEGTKSQLEATRVDNLLLQKKLVILQRENESLEAERRHLIDILEKQEKLKNEATKSVREIFQKQRGTIAAYRTVLTDFHMSRPMTISDEEVALLTGRKP